MGRSREQDVSQGTSLKRKRERHTRLEVVEASSVSSRGVTCPHSRTSTQPWTLRKVSS